MIATVIATVVASASLACVDAAEPAVARSERESVLAAPSKDDAPVCIEPASVGPWLSAPSPAPTPGEILSGGVTDDGQVVFHPGGSSKFTSTIKVRLSLGEPDSSGRDDRLFRDVAAKNAVVRVVAGTDPDRGPSDRMPLAGRSSTRYAAARGAGTARAPDVVLEAKTRRLDQLELVQTYAIEVARDGSAQVAVSAVDLVAKDDGASVARAVFDPELGLASPPTTCIEHAMVRFGPLPWDMPPVKFPDIDGCNSEDCIAVAHGWLRTHHNAWRANQMFQVLRDMPSYSRSFFWKQPGLDQHHNELGQRTKPEYWWGGFNSDRFDAIQDGIGTYWAVVKTARIDVIDLTLHCKYNGADPCNTVRPLGYHTVKGHINVCNQALDFTGTTFANSQEAVTRTVGHEALHHVWLQWGNGKTYALSDTVTHWHGKYCNTSPDTHAMYGEDQIRHLATYNHSKGGGCNHRKKLYRRVDAYATFAHEIGEMVRARQMWWWPAPAPPTPQPPSCVGDPGCLCSDVPQSGPAIPPDGDYSIDHYCDDHTGNETTCQTTRFNASDTVGICVECTDVRGPGCECDLSMPCDVGECFGDDTWGGGVGRCYEDLPPSWACAADCERLFNDPLAYCYNDHLGGARCMDSDCQPWDAEDCYQQGMLCRGGECVVECESQVDCADAGYPSYYECASSGRCEPYWWGN